MALVQALRQLDGDASVGVEAWSRIQAEAEPESGRCLRACHVAAHRGCDSAEDCPEVRRHNCDKIALNPLKPLYNP